MIPKWNLSAAFFVFIKYKKHKNFQYLKKLSLKALIVACLIPSGGEIKFQIEIKG